MSNNMKFVCKPSGKDPKGQPLLSFAQSVPDGMEIGKTTNATCVATKQDFATCETKQYEIKNTTNPALKGRFVVSYNLPFLVDVEFDGEVRSIRKLINCNDREVIANTAYRVIKIEEVDKKTGKTYPKFALL